LNQFYKLYFKKSNKVLPGFTRRIVLILLTAYCLLPTSVFSQLNANFSASSTSGCSPLIVSFTDQSTGNPTSWSWNFGNSGVSTNQNPSTIYSTPGVYSVTLTISNGINTDTEVKTAYINVYNKPQANFTVSTDTACVGQNVTITSTTVISPGGAPIASYAWDFGDGNSQTVATSAITHAYNVAGTYPVSLIVTDTTGCTGVINIPNAIVVVPVPNAAFTASPNSACVPPLTVNFNNSSTHVGTTTYSWSFGDGSNSTQYNPTHTYTANGTYSVTLVINQNGCIDSITVPNAVIIQNIAASFAAIPTVICTGHSISFTNTSVPAATTASWNFGDASTSTTISPSHTYTSAGTYTVTLISSDASGCIDTTTSTVTVNQTPVAGFSADTMVACNVPFTVNFTNTSTGGTNYSWNFGDNSVVSTIQNPSHTYTAAGTYSVSLIVTNASGPCSDSIAMLNYITISPPLASFTHSPDSGCVPLTVNFLSTSVSTIDPLATYSWTFGDGSSATSAVAGTSHTYTATGVYSVTLTITTANGCTDTAVCINCIKVGTTPVANFGIVQDTVCFGLPVMFNDSSTGVVTGWHWLFGDGGSSAMQNPTYTYGDTGTFQVYLIAYNNGCADTSLIQNVVILPPIARFTYTLSCTNYYTVQFTSTSAGADSLTWDFGDGSVDTMNNINVTHIYPTRGPVTVTLVAYNYTTSCSNTITATFTIAEPIASYSMASNYGCYPFNAVFTSTSQDANAYWWNFGDPLTSADTATTANPSYLYNNPGAYTFTMIITDVNNCRDTLQDTVKALGPLPYFFADTLTGCTPFMVTFSDTSRDDSLLVQWVWNFGDGSPVVTTPIDSVVHVYTLPGIYTVTMTVTDTNGCAKTLIKTNYIQPTYPFPSFTVDTFACKGDILTLDASATVVVGGSYMWNYGDGQQDTTLNAVITHSYTIDGLYIVSLTVVDTNGCDSTVTDTVRILKPTANFGDTILNTGCGTLTVSFIDSSTGYVSQWYWDFGNGANSTLQDPTYTYTQPGIYNVTLYVWNLGGCKDTIIMDSIIVVPGPVGSFSFTPAGGCNPLTVCFDGTSLNAQQYIWDFGDGSLAYSSDTCHTYSTLAAMQNFNPVLIMGNTLPDSSLCLLPATNLTGTVTVTNVIPLSLSQPSIVTLPEDSILPVTATFSGGMPPYTYGWSPNTGLSCDSCTSVLIIGLGDTILYTFSVYDTAGCMNTATILIQSEPCIEEKLIPNVFTPNGDGMNDLFYIPGVCPKDKYSLQIFDRWGILLFTTTLRNNGWDGRTNSGEEASEGVYYYVVSMHVIRPVEEDRTYKGFFHLMR
jgi:gliding motility-associated-like protein